MSRKSGKQTKQEKAKEVDQLQEESSPYGISYPCIVVLIHVHVQLEI